jgi:hypothetical protein
MLATLDALQDLRQLAVSAVLQELQQTGFRQGGAGQSGPRVPSTVNALHCLRNLAVGAVQEL